jgi:hypothetical protein
LKKIFRVAKGHQWRILEKDIVDKVVFKMDNPRDRLMLELMDREALHQENCNVVMCILLNLYSNVKIIEKLKTQE